MSRPIDKSTALVARAEPRVGSIVPQTIEEVQRYARMAMAAGLAPKERGGDAGPDATLAKVALIIMHGLECGLKPMQALAGIAIINGRTQIWGDLLTALLWSHGFKVEKSIDGDGDNRKGVARITRPDGTIITGSFSIPQARQARLWDTREKVRKKSRDGGTYEADNDSPWHKYPDDMLQWKALARAVKTGASDVTRGLALREDMEHPQIEEEEATIPAQFLIPDVPSIPNIPPVQDVNYEEAEEMLIDGDGFFSHLADQVAGAGGDKAILAEIAEHNQDLLHRLPADLQAKAKAMLEPADAEF